MKYLLEYANTSPKNEAQPLVVATLYYYEFAIYSSFL